MGRDQRTESLTAQSGVPMPSGGNVLLRGAELFCCNGLDNMLGRGSSLSQRKEPILTLPAFICCFCCCCCGKGWGQRVCVMWGSLNRKELQERKKKAYLSSGMAVIWFESLRDDVTPGSAFVAHQFQVVKRKRCGSAEESQRQAVLIYLAAPPGWVIIWLWACC